MQIQTYSNEIHLYNLEEGYSLQRADNQEFTKYWAVYRASNEDFTQSFTQMQEELAGVPFCFWVLNGETRVAGMVMLPNGIGDFFLIPPETDGVKILNIVMPLLAQWSDKTIKAQEIVSAYLGAFQEVGFNLQESRMWMIRPTQSFEINWPAEWTIEGLKADQSEEIAALFERAFSGSVGEYGTRDLEAHLSSVNNFFGKYAAEDVCGKASALVKDKHTQQVIGGCLVELHHEIPSLRFIAVDPNHGRKGMGTLLLRRAIHTLAGKYNWVKLAVTVGNPAVGLYQNEGFISGDVTHTLVKA